MFLDDLFYILAAFGGFIGVTITLDRLLSENYRSQIGTAFKKRLRYNRFGKKDILVAIDAVVWKDTFSFRFFARTLITSLLSLSVILLFQFLILRHSASELLPDGFSIDKATQFSFLLFLIASNLLVDYFSFTQTSVLLNLINKSKSVGSIAIIMLCDLLASLNIFALTFAFFLYIGIVHIANDERRTEFVVWTEQIEQERWSYVQEAVSKAENIDEIGSVTEVYIRTLDGKRRFAFGNPEHDVRIIFIEEKQTQTSSIRERIPEVLKTFYPSFEIERKSGLLALSATDQDFQIEYDFIGSIKHLASEEAVLWLWYSQLYLLVDTVQDNFVNE